MSDPPKSASTISFGTTSTSGGSGLFGTAPTNNSSGGRFVSGTAEPASQGNTIFESNNTTSGNPSSSLFGSTLATSAPAASIFGGGAGAGSSESIFRDGQSSSGESVLGGGSTSNTGFSTPSKGADAPSSSATQTPSLYGGGASTGGKNIFSNLGGHQGTSSQDGSITPVTSNPGGGFVFGGLSTTPAGPPPLGNIDPSQSTGSLFNFTKPKDQKSTTFSNIAPSSSTASSNIFGDISQSGTASIFGSSKPADSSAPTSTTQNASNLFGGAPPTSGSNTGLFGTAPANSGPSLFGSTNTAPSSGPSLISDLGTTQTSTGQTTQGDIPKTSFFPSLGGQNAPNATTQSSGFSLLGGSGNNVSSTPTQSAFSFPAATTAQSAARIGTGPASSGTTGLFGSRGGATVTSPTGTGPPSSQTGGLFPPSPGKGLDLNIGKMSTSASGAPTSASAPGQSSLFGNTSNPANSLATASKSQSASKTTMLSAGDDSSKATANLGTSTSGPRPPAQSRLKNKSMDEIITRWASDLSKYQKEFQKQALKVSEWDRMLVENSDKIQKLYGSTLEAERATIEVERQLSTVENDQAELEYWLDHYERQVDELISSQIGQGDTTQGPDQERERT